MLVGFVKSPEKISYILPFVELKYNLLDAALSAIYQQLFVLEQKRKNPTNCHLDSGSVYFCVNHQLTKTIVRKSCVSLDTTNTLSIHYFCTTCYYDAHQLKLNTSLCTVRSGRASHLLLFVAPVVVIVVVVVIGLINP